MIGLISLTSIVSLASVSAQALITGVGIKDNSPIDIVVTNAITSFDYEDFEDKLKQALQASGVDTDRVRVTIENAGKSGITEYTAEDILYTWQPCMNTDVAWHLPAPGENVYGNIAGLINKQMHSDRTGWVCKEKLGDKFAINLQENHIIYEYVHASAGYIEYRNALCGIMFNVQWDEETNWPTDYYACIG